MKESVDYHDVELPPRVVEVPDYSVVVDVAGHRRQITAEGPQETEGMFSQLEEVDVFFMYG